MLRDDKDSVDADADRSFDANKEPLLKNEFESGVSARVDAELSSCSLLSWSVTFCRILVNELVDVEEPVSVPDSGEELRVSLSEFSLVSMGVAVKEESRGVSFPVRRVFSVLSGSVNTEDEVADPESG